MLVAQPTLSQQIRRLEDIIGTPLLDRRRDGVRLTDAGSVLLEESRTVLSLIEHGVRRSRQAAGLDRPRLRFALPPQLPEELAADTAVRLWSVAALAGVDVTWLEAPVDAGFSLIRQRRADAALGWVTSDRAVLPDPLDVMSLGEFEPEVWIPARAASAGAASAGAASAGAASAGTESAGAEAGDRGVIGLAELAGMEVLHGPRRASRARTTPGLRCCGPCARTLSSPILHCAIRCRWRCVRGDRGPADRGPDRPAARRRRPGGR